MLYRTFKRNFVFENYLTTLSPYNRKLLCKFRTINHTLPIEVGRYSGRPRFTQNCDKCNIDELGDEFHFLLQCPALSDLRKTYLPIYCQNRPSTHKFESIMSSDAIHINIKLARYIRLAFKRFNMYIWFILYLNSIPRIATMWQHCVQTSVCSQRAQYWGEATQCCHKHLSCNV